MTGVEAFAKHVVKTEGNEPQFGIQKNAQLGLKVYQM